MLLFFQQLFWSLFFPLLPFAAAAAAGDFICSLSFIIAEHFLLFFDNSCYQFSFYFSSCIKLVLAFPFSHMLLKLISFVTYKQ
jgi:hypothetical protein